MTFCVRIGGKANHSHRANFAGAFGRPVNEATLPQLTTGGISFTPVCTALAGGNFRAPAAGEVITP